MGNVTSLNNRFVARGIRFILWLRRGKDYYFDNLEPLDGDKVFQILPLYNNKQMAKKIRKYYENFKAEKEPEK